MRVTVQSLMCKKIVTVHEGDRRGRACLPCRLAAMELAPPSRNPKRISPQRHRGHGRHTEKTLWVNANSRDLSGRKQKCSSL
jgi:hypothetical protein